MKKRLNYRMLFEYNVGTEENPVQESEVRGVIAIVDEEQFEEAYALAKEQAYLGEVTVEDIEDPITEPTELDLAVERIAELEAYNAALEDAMCEMDAANQEQITELQATNVALEDAMCEMDAANEARFSTIEDALCELDMV